jgi:hypothetical protein
VKLSFAAAFVVITLFSVLPASAACKRSCSEVAGKCASSGGGARCYADLESCKKTGNLGMPSGRTFTNLCKN